MTHSSSPGAQRGDRTQPDGAKQRTVVRIAAVSALGGLLFGYDTGVISGALLFIKKDLHLSSFGQSLVTSMILVGCIIGALAAGPLADRYGRRRVLLSAAVVFAVGALASAFSPTTGALIASRIVLGLGVGCASLLVPLYIAEVAPARVRGALVSLNQLMIIIGIVVSYGVDYLLAGMGAWRWMFGLAVIPAVVLGAGMLTVPETPRWLVMRNRRDEARGILGLIRDAADIDRELADIDTMAQQQKNAGMTVLVQPWLRPALVVGAGLAIIQQWTGTNAVIYFAPTILQQGGFGTSAAILSTFGIGLVEVIFTVVSIRIVDRVGRRPLLLWGTSVMGAALVALGFLFFAGVTGAGTVLCLMVYEAAFSISLGPVVWLILSEMFPLQVRGQAMALATLLVWAADLVLTLTFLPLLSALGGSATFWMFAGICALAVLFMYFMAPETKGRTLEQIEADLRGGHLAGAASQPVGTRSGRAV